VPRWWKGALDGAQVIGADIGPSKTPPLDDPTAAQGTAVSNSKNHGGIGQNVLFADTRVEFARNSTVGKGGDNIYTADNDSIYVAPKGAKFNKTANLNSNSLDTILAPATP